MAKASSELWRYLAAAARPKVRLRPDSSSPQCSRQIDNSCGCPFPRAPPLCSFLPHVQRIRVSLLVFLFLLFVEASQAAKGEMPDLAALSLNGHVAPDKASNGVLASSPRQANGHPVDAAAVAPAQTAPDTAATAGSKAPTQTEPSTTGATATATAAEPPQPAALHAPQGSQTRLLENGLTELEMVVPNRLVGRCVRAWLRARERFEERGRRSYSIKALVHLLYRLLTVSLSLFPPLTLLQHHWQRWYEHP